MNRVVCGLFSLLFAVSSTVLLIPPSVVNAASPQDDDLKLAEELHIGASNWGTGSLSCSPVETTITWSEVLLDDDTVFYDEASSYGGTQDNSQEHFDEVQESFLTAIENSDTGGSWGVSSYSQYIGDTYVHGYYIFWNETEPLDLVFSGGNVISGNVDGTVRITNDIQSSGGSCDYLATYQSFIGNIVSSETSDDADYAPKLLFATNANVDYPDGYEGPLVPDTWSPDPVLPIIKPEFEYSVNKKVITAKDHKQELPAVTPSEGYTVNGYSVGWSLFKCASWDDVSKVCTDSELVDYEILPQNQQYQQDVDDYGDYQLQAQYLVQECYRYPSYPITPDLCVYIDLGVELPEYDFDTTTIHLLLDGNAISGDTRDDECDEYGYCEPPSPYEDCSTYGVDLLGGFICVMKNFGIFLGELFKQLFIPSPAFYDAFFESLTGFLEGKFGFVYTSFTFIIDWIEQITDLSPQCNMGAVNGTFWDATVTIDFCQFENMSPTIFNAIMIPLRLLTAGVMVFIGYRRLISIIKGLGA